MFTASELFTSTAQTAVLLNQPAGALRHAKGDTVQALCLSTAIYTSSTSRLRMRQAATTSDDGTFRSLSKSAAFIHRTRFPKYWILTNTATNTSNISSFDFHTRRGNFSECTAVKLSASGGHRTRDLWPRSAASGCKTKRRHVTRQTLLTLSTLLSVVFPRFPYVRYELLNRRKKVFKNSAQNSAKFTIRFVHTFLLTVPKNGWRNTQTLSSLFHVLGKPHYPKNLTFWRTVPRLSLCPVFCQWRHWMGNTCTVNFVTSLFETPS